LLGHIKHLHTAGLSPRRDDVWALCLALHAIDSTVVLHDLVLEYSVTLVLVRVRVCFIVAIVLGFVEPRHFQD
jgi:hypothetical protein